MQSPFNLSGKVAVVTGAAQGLGAAITRALAVQGATLAACDLDAQQVAATAASITEETGGIIHSLACDVGDRQQASELVDRVVRELGRIDVLINNAGIHRRGSPDDFDQQDIDDIIRVNLLGSFYMAGAAGAVMVAQRSGSIVNMSALGGGIVGLGRGGSIYGMTKGGIVSLTRDLAAEWGPYGVRVNALAPGWIRTPMTQATQQNVQRSAKILQRVPLGRWGEPEEVAAVAVFLASDAARYVTGHTIPVDGGAANVIALDNTAPTNPETQP